MNCLPILAAAVVFMATQASAKPPEGVVIDPKVHEWFENLVRADGAHCCAEADCRLAESNELRLNAAANGWQIFLNGAWVDVPDSMVVHRDSSPLGGSIICRSRYTEEESPEGNNLYCVIPITGY